MDEKDIHALSKLAEALNAIDQHKLYIIAGVIVIIIVGYFLRYYLDYISKNKSYKHNEKLLGNITCVLDSLKEHENASNSRMDRLVSVMEEIRDRQKNVISKSDSVRIVLNKFNDVIKKEIIVALEWSIKNNNYVARKEFVRKKIKTAIAEIIMLARRSLSEFKLSIDLDQFFITYTNERDGNIHYKLVDQIWDEIESIYHKDRYQANEQGSVLNQQLEEMEIAVNNIITAELTKIQMEINNLYR